MGKIALRSEKRSVHQKENGEGKGVRETTTTLKGGQKTRHAKEDGEPTSEQPSERKRT